MRRVGYTTALGATVFVGARIPSLAMAPPALRLASAIALVAVTTSTELLERRAAEAGAACDDRVSGST